MARSLRNKLASLTLCCTVVATSPAVMMASTVLQESTSQQEVTEEVHEAVTFPLEGEYIIDQAHEAVTLPLEPEEEVEEEHGAVILPLEPEEEVEEEHGVVTLPLEPEEEHGAVTLPVVTPTEEVTEQAVKIEKGIQSEVIMPEDGEYTIQLDVWKENENVDSMASQFFDKQAKLSVEGGQGTLTITVTTTAFGVSNAIGELEKKINEGYEVLSMTPIEGTDKVQVDIPVDNISDEIYVRCSIVRPISMQQILRLAPQVDTLKSVDAEQVVQFEVAKTDLTQWGKQDGTIQIVASGGTGTGYDYSIDGGQTWLPTAYFEGLEAGEYSVMVRDAQDLSQQASDIVLIEGINAGTYTADIKVLHADKDEESMSQSFFKKEELALEVQDGKGYLTIEVNKDGMGMTDLIAGIQQKVGEEYIPLELAHLDDDEIRVVTTQIAFEAQDEDVYLSFNISNMHSGAILRIRLDNISQNGETVNPAPQEPVSIAIQSTDTTHEGAQNGTITLEATGGDGVYEYTVNKGETWKEENQFTNLVAGTYEVAARDSKGNQSEFTTVVIKDKVTAPTQGLQDGQYSVDIRVLQESSDSASMATQFFQQEGLPLEIIGGKAYLTIQVLKDGMGMKDVISSLEQRTGSGYQDLYLNYINDSSTRYVTAEVAFESINEDVYLRCGIVPVAPMKPVLRIQLIEDSIQEGLGRINTGLEAQSVATITEVKAENGKVSITLSEEDESLTQNDFTSKLYKDGETQSTDLQMENFNIEGTIVTFTYEEIEQSEVEQKFSVGITFNELETKSNTFSVLAIGQSASLLKDNALEIKYIKGYEDGTFRPNKEVSKAEALSMLGSLINVPEKTYQSATIDVVQAEKDTESIAKQFFKTEGINIVLEEDKYYVELEIANEGLGFTNIINSIEHKVDGAYQTLEVIKTSDLKKAYVRVEVENLNDAITLRTGIAPMGDVKPELRVIIKEVEDSEYKTQFTDIEMWAKKDIMMFEELGIIGEDKSSLFNPNQAMTRGEFAKIIASVMGLELDEAGEDYYTDLANSPYQMYINACSEAGYINGYEDNSFKPDATITRAEIVTLINRVIGHSEETNLVLEEDAKSPFEDLEASHWAYQDIIKVTQ